MNRTIAAAARKRLLRRGRALLRLRQDFSGETKQGDDGPDYLAGLSDGERFELAEIHSALERIERGIFGRCDTCFERIEVSRIEEKASERECSACEEREPLHAGEQEQHAAV
jgi:RNA polymerase-binding transcription factor DksA